MGRPRDEEAWEQVIKNENGTWTCKRCGRNFKGGATRIRDHLGTVKRKGIALCEGSSVPSNEGGNRNSTAMGMAGSSDPMARQDHQHIYHNIPASTSNHQNVIPGVMARYADYTINSNIINHQYVPPANNLVEAGGAANEVDYNNNNNIECPLNYQYDTELHIHTSQGLPNNVDDAVGNDHGGFEGEISQLKELIHMLTTEEGNIESEVQWLESRTGQKRRRDADDEAYEWCLDFPTRQKLRREREVNKWLKEVKELKERANKIRIELLSGQGLSTERSALEEKINKLREDVHTHIEGKPFVLPSNEFMLDQNFDENLDVLFELEEADNVPLIGVHGMGGVGKTSLVTHFKNEILRDGDFKDVIWVTVSQDFTIFKLQSAIAKRINIKLDEDDEIVERAKSLLLALDKKGKLLLILDDVWNYIDLQKVGIPLRAVNGIKLILTSRLKHVFQQMDCPPDSIIQMEPLHPWTDAWELFLLKLGCYGTPATLSPEIEKIAKSIVERCNGLPLGISVMARIMKGVKDIRQWRHALYKLENSAMGGEMEDEVIKSLKLSYDHLIDKNIQNCFLVCTLYIHDECSKAELIMKLVDEGLIIKEMKSLEEVFDEGYAILDQLEGHSLLCESKMDEDCLSMNGLVRDMASYVVKGRYMVKCNQSLRKVPEEWAPNLEKVSLMRNHIEEIPEGTSPRCPQLSTLILSWNDLSQIPNCFFSNMDSLTILDLSYNKELTSLPNSLSRLRSLKSLLLNRCSSLKYVPSLCELRELTRLVISKTSIEQVPEGLAMLVKLRWLDLSYNEELSFVPWSLLLGLTNMQYLDLRSPQVTVEVENVKEMMSVLEYFGGCFPVSKDFADYVENILDRGIGPKHCHLRFGIGHFGTYIKYDPISLDGHLVSLSGDGEAVNHLLPRDLPELRISCNKQWSRGICECLSFKAPSSLRKIDVTNCPKLERLFCLTGSCSFCKHLHNLQSLTLRCLESVEVIWKEIDEGMSLPNLTSLTLRECHKMEKLLTPEALLQLPNLEAIDVWNCKSMKEIFAGRSSDEGDDNIDSTITLPNSFKNLTLHRLPQLKNVCASIMVSESRPTLYVICCPELRMGSVRYKSSHSDLNTHNLW